MKSIPVYVDSEDCMTATAMFIHVVRPNSPILQALLQHSQQVVKLGTFNTGQKLDNFRQDISAKCWRNCVEPEEVIYNKGSAALVPTNCQVRAFCSRVQQVNNLEKTKMGEGWCLKASVLPSRCRFRGKRLLLRRLRRLSFFPTGRTDIWTTCEYILKDYIELNFPSPSRNAQSNIYVQFFQVWCCVCCASPVHEPVILVHGSFPSARNLL